MDPRRRKTRLKLQAALRSLLSEKPLRAISVEELARKARTTRQTFYSHYGSLAEMLDEYFSLLLKELEARHARVDDDLDSAARFAAHRTKFASIFGDIDRDDPRLRALLDGVPGLAPEDRFAALLEQLLIRAPAYPHGRDPEMRRVAARFYTGAFVAVLRDWLRRPDAMDADRLAHAFTTLIFRGWPDDTPPIGA